MLLTDIGLPHEASGWWIGASRTGTQDVWVWYNPSGFETVRHSDWAQGEPNKHFGSNEDCVEIRPLHDFRWNDLICDAKNAFICEMIPEGITIG